MIPEHQANTHHYVKLVKPTATANALLGLLWLELKANGRTAKST